MNWSSVARRLSRQLDENRRLEIASHIADANDNGESVTPKDVGSIALLVGRAKATQAKLELPNIVAGLPIALLCLWTYDLVYSEHLQAKELPSNDPTIALLQRIAEQAWVLLIPLGFYTGWRVIQRFRTGPRWLPIAFLTSLLALCGHSLWSLLGPWTGSGTKAINDGLWAGYYSGIISIQSLLFASLALTLPLTFAAADWALRVRNRRKKPRNDHHVRPSSASPPLHMTGPEADINRDSWAVAAIALGGATLFPIFSSVVAIPFVLATWMASSFSRTQKLLATVSGLGVVLLFGLVMMVFQKPGLIIYTLPIQLLIQLGVWISMAITVARKPTISDSTTQRREEPNFGGLS